MSPAVMVASFGNFFYVRAGWRVAFLSVLSLSSSFLFDCLGVVVWGIPTAHLVTIWTFSFLYIKPGYDNLLTASVANGSFEVCLRCNLSQDIDFPMLLLYLGESESPVDLRHSGSGMTELLFKREQVSAIHHVLD